MLTIKKKSLLYKSGAGYADYCINHVEGCSHGCRFPCYAMIMKNRCGKIKNYNDWIKPKLVVNALELLNDELPRLKNKIKVAHLCFTTDPFMYKQPEVASLTLKIIERLNQENIKCMVLTKGAYPTQLVDVKKYGQNNEYGITLVSLKKDFKNRMEPYTISCVKRVKSLRFLHEKGLKTWVSMEPYPTPNIIKQNLLEILQEISFVDRIIFGKLNYNIKSSNQFIENRNFYQKHAEIVIDFCRKHKIKYHIKYGTSEKHDKRTKRIFKEESQIRKLDGVLPIPI